MSTYAPIEVKHISLPDLVETLLQGLGATSVMFMTGLPNGAVISVWAADTTQSKYPAEDRLHLAFEVYTILRHGRLSAESISRWFVKGNQYLENRMPVWFIKEQPIRYRDRILSIATALVEASNDLNPP